MNRFPYVIAASDLQLLMRELKLTKKQFDKRYKVTPMKVLHTKALVIDRRK